MQAAIIHEYGPPSVLGLGEFPDPKPGPGEVVVELRAAALNRRDTYLRKGANPAYRFPLPLILGSDGAGVRRGTGAGGGGFPMLPWGGRGGGAAGGAAPAAAAAPRAPPPGGPRGVRRGARAETPPPPPPRLSWHE